MVFNPARIAPEMSEAAAEMETAQRLYDGIRSSGRLQNRTVSLKAWAKYLACVKKRREDYSEVIEWVIANMPVLRFLGGSVQSPRALNNKWDRILEWMAISERAKAAEVDKNDGMIDQYTECAALIQDAVPTCALDNEALVLGIQKLTKEVLRVIEKVAWNTTLPSPAMREAVIDLVQLMESFDTMVGYHIELITQLMEWEAQGGWGNRRWPIKRSSNAELFVMWIIKRRMSYQHQFSLALQQHVKDALRDE